MEGIYDIYRGQDKIGKAQVSREGLYYRFQCCCDLTGQVIHRLIVACGEKTENLGIPVPDGDAFYLTTRLPVSHFPQGEPTFRAVPKHPQGQKLWVPIAPDTPFEYISRLENAVAQRREEGMGILIQEEPAPTPRDSDQNQEYPSESSHP